MDGHRTEVAEEDTGLAAAAAVAAAGSILLVAEGDIGPGAGTVPGEGDTGRSPAEVVVALRDRMSALVWR